MVWFTILDAGLKLCAWESTKAWNRLALGRLNMNSTITTPPTIATALSQFLAEKGFMMNPLKVGQIVRADLDVGETNDGSDVGYPYRPGLKIVGIGYHDLVCDRTAQSYEDLAGRVIAAPDWGFKTALQFKQALRLAHEFGHHWAQPTYILERIDLPNGAVKLVETPVFPIDPNEACSASNYRYMNERDTANYRDPTPSWVSGSGTYRVCVFPDGGYTIVYNGILKETFAPQITSEGVMGISKKLELMPDWHKMDFTWNWEGKNNGRGQTLAKSVKLACARGRVYGQYDLAIVEIFESDRQFWRTGFVAGTRWYE